MKKLLQLGCIFYSLTAFSQVDLISNLKVCMPFTGNANDQSGSNNNGTVSGATLTSDRFNNANSAYQFNGTSNYISVPNFAAIAPTNELTISMWAKSDLTTSNCLFMLSPDDPADRCVGCAQYSNAGSTMMIWDYGSISGNGRTTVPSIPADLSGWHHYVYIVSQSGNQKQMYLDGVVKSNVAYTGTCNNKNLPLYIGAGNDGGQGGNIRFRGKIDDVCIYNRALTAAEVSALNSQQTLCETSTGIDQLTSFSGGVLYPAVSGDGIFAYSGDLSKLNTVTVYSIDGKLMTSFSADALLNSQQIDLSSLSNGLYFVAMTKEGKTTTQKIVISQ